MSLMALGYTATDPSGLVEEEEGDGPPPPPPAHPEQVPQSYVAGYARSAYWDGERIEIESIFKSVKPYKIFTIGALATLGGVLEIYVNRRLAVTIDAAMRGMTAMDTDNPLYAIIDASGGLKKATLLTDSVPPSPEEDESGSPQPDE